MFMELLELSFLFFVIFRFIFQVAGGDGTAGWLLGVVSDLKLRKPPSIATVPLGTGNNLPFAFGWVSLASVKILRHLW